MTLNFYLRKYPSKGEMRAVERHNLAKVRILLKKQGVKNVFKLDYHEAIQTLAKQIAEECGRHRMRKATTGHRLTTAGIAGDTSSERFRYHKRIAQQVGVPGTFTRIRPPKLEHQMLKYKQTTITINGAKTKGYRVEGLNVNVFRGLQVTVVKDSGRWTAHETTTGLSITPPSWAGGYSNKTREGLLQIVANFLSNAPESGWTHIQEQLDYDVNGTHTLKRGTCASLR